MPVQVSCGPGTATAAAPSPALGPVCGRALALRAWAAALAAPGRTPGESEAPPAAAADDDVDGSVADCVRM